MGLRSIPAPVPVRAERDMDHHHVAKLARRSPSSQAFSDHSWPKQRRCWSPEHGPQRHTRSGRVLCCALSQGRNQFYSSSCVLRSMRDARGKRCACALLVFHTKHEVSGTKRF